MMNQSASAVPIRDSRLLFLTTLVCILAFSTTVILGLLRALEDSRFRFGQDSRKAILEQEASVLSRGLFPEIRISSELKKAVIEASTVTEEGGRDPEVHTRLSRSMKALSSDLRLPMGWVTFSLAPPEDSLSLPTYEAVRLREHGGEEIVKASPQEMERFCRKLILTPGGDWFSMGIDQEDFPWLPLDLLAESPGKKAPGTTRLGKRSSRVLSTKLALGRCQMLADPSNPCIFFWYPLFDSPRLFLDCVPRTDDFEETRKHLAGGILVFIRPSGITTESALRCLAGNLRKRGIALFLRNEALRNAAGLAGNPPPTVGPGAQDSLECLVPTFQQGEFVEAVLSIEIPEAEKTSGIFVPVIPILVMWILGVIVFSLPSLYPSGSFQITIRWQLAGVFLLVSVPTLLIGFLFLERSFLEREIGRKESVKKQLERKVRGFDEAYLLGEASTCAATRGLVESFRTRLLDSGAATQTGIIKINGTLGEACPKILQEVANGATTLGLSPQAIIVHFLGKPSLIFAGGMDDERQVNAFRSLFGEFAQGMMRALSGTSESGTARSMRTGLMVDEMVDMMVALSKPEYFTNMFHAPFSVSDFTVLGVQQFIYIQFCKGGGGKSLIFQATWPQKAAGMAAFRSFIRTPEGVRDCEHFLQVSKRDSPDRDLVYPFFTGTVFERQVQGGGKVFASILEENAQLQPPFLGDLCTQAAVAREPIFREVDSGNDRLLAFAYPGPAYEGFMISGAVWLRQFFDPLRVSRFQVRVLTIGILVLIGVLGYRVSRRFLRPITTLHGAAEKVRKGDFTVRLPEGYGGEVGNLFRAFNGMVKGVEEGQLLGRFVSESVQSVARDVEAEKFARTGILVDRVILFLKWHGFAWRLQKENPEILIRDLNHFVETMSQIIRRHGGEIDKFIGDKILAVFAPDDTGLGNAVEAAMNTAIEMTGLMPTISNAPGTGLAVGIVTGPVLAGIMGTEEVLRQFTVIGDTVNLAARLCELASKEHHGGIILDRTTLDELEPTGLTLESGRVRRLHTNKIRGKSREVDIFALNA